MLAKWKLLFLQRGARRKHSHATEQGRKKPASHSRHTRRQTQKDDGMPKRGLPSSWMVFRPPFVPLSAAGLLVWFIISQTYNQWGLLRPTLYLFLQPPLGHQLRTQGTCQDIVEWTDCLHLLRSQVFVSPESLTSCRDIIRLRKFSCENMILVLHDYYSVINLFIMLFPIR